jgi:hypothetical protein
MRLLDDVDWLYYEERPAATCLALATIAQEEFAKAFFLALVDRGVIAWNSLVNRATRDHTCKQLLGLVLSHLSPDDDEENKRSDEFMTGVEEHKRLMNAYKKSLDENERDSIWARITAISSSWNSLPQSVSDAIFILRHEKIGRWEPSFSEWVGRTVPQLYRRENPVLTELRLPCHGKTSTSPLYLKQTQRNVKN